MSRKFAEKFGLGIGISSGANFLAGVLMNKNPLKIVTVFPDDNKKYITTKLSEKVADESNLISNQIKLIDFEVL